MKNDAKRKVRKTVAVIAVTAFMICTSAAAYAACNTYLAGKCKTKFVNCMKINGSDCEQKYIACMQAAGCTSML